MASTRKELRDDAANLTYLAEVRNVTPPINDRLPIWLRHGTVRSGPPAESPQRHPCYEFGIGLCGSGIELVGSERAERRPGDLLLVGPGVPHWIEITEYPLEFVTVFFLPSVLTDLGTDFDGLNILRRFASTESIHQRLVRPSPPLRRWMERKFAEMVHEFEHTCYGRGIRLRTLLLDMLVALMRWEQKSNQQVATSEFHVEWQKVYAALEYLRTHFTEPVYARDVAQAAGITEAQLKRIFHAAVGMPWGRYLQSYRIHRAAELLSQTELSVLEVSLAVGIETLSHFNATFRRFTGMSPRDYRLNIAAEKPAKPDRK